MNAVSPRLNAERVRISVTAVYSGSAVLLNWGHTAKGGMTIETVLKDCGLMDVHPFKGMGCGKENGQRFRIFVALGETNDDLADQIYAGEAVLMKWSDDSINGTTCRFLIDGGPDGANGRHPCEGLSIGRREGEPLILSAWAVADDERPEDPGRARRRSRTPFFEQSEVKQAGILCRDDRFASFIAGIEAELLIGKLVSPRPEENHSEYAAAVVRSYLDIASRAELAHDTVKGQKSREKWVHLVNRYMDHMNWSGLRG
ncbi:hypothetical protein [Roseibium sp. RKSG952]|uniref:hypothetical protein n=1 Tax=Roseibium sp. RKSG952 TaxID=2529384 RepID=UPI0012BCC1B3|nr:hypothetical protein [Roseibium sp. RKSG952]MTH97578.1 hypothetical protein [Roseibium sp. RKSG952]